MPLPTVPYGPRRVPAEVSIESLREAYGVANQRRSIRHFSQDPVPMEVIELAIAIAGTAPSGAHRQPWHFVAISDPNMKARLREAAEAEEREFYSKKATPEWLAALEPLGTDFVKSHLTDAPWIVIVFREDYGISADGSRIKNYYMTESVGIAVGFFIQALHRAGLSTLTHTPSPMTFLRELCGRPANEKPLVVIPVGYPADDCRVPDLTRKSLAEIATFI